MIQDVEYALESPSLFGWAELPAPALWTPAGHLPFPAALEQTNSDQDTPSRSFYRIQKRFFACHVIPDIYTSHTRATRHTIHVGISSFRPRNYRRPIIQSNNGFSPEIDYLHQRSTMYQTLLLGALVGASFVPRVAVAASTTTNVTDVGVATSQSVAQRKQSGANAQSAGVPVTGDDMMRIIRKASIEKAIDLTFWW